MDIFWLGQACFKLKGKTATVIIDPYDPTATGLKLPKDLTADFSLSSHDHPDHNNTSVIKTSTGEEAMVFNEVGEYEVNGAVVTAIESFHDNSNGSERGKNLIFHIILDNLNIVHLGDLGQESLTEEQLTLIGQTDILLIPVGGIYTIDAKTASNVVAQLEPSIIIPMHYKIEGLKYELEPLDNFLKEMSLENVTPLAKLPITKDKLPEEPQVVVLTKS